MITVGGRMEHAVMQFEKEVEKLREKLGLRKLENEIPLSMTQKMKEPVLITRATSISGKLYLAAEIQNFNTIGMDAVAVAVNDLLVERANPLLFYDSISCARPKVERIKEIEAGAEQCCLMGDVRYVGSEIKELPDIISYEQYDMVGFAAGVIDKDMEKEPSKFRDGDVIIGLPSNGLHNNGYMLARKKLYLSKASMEVYYETLGTTLGELLMQPTRLYRQAMEEAYQSGIEVKSCAQVGHGGLDAAVRLLLKNRAGAVIKQRMDHLPPLYWMLHKDGSISEEQMRQTFNMGFGMLLLVAESDADIMMEVLEKAGENPHPLGLVERDSYTIRYIM